jgi:hypothetical protein
LAQLHALEADFAAREKTHQATSVLRRDLLHPLRQAHAVRAHDGMVAESKRETVETVASFLIAARPHWGHEIFKKYHEQLADIELLTEMAQMIGMFQNGGAPSRAVALEGRACELLFEDFVRHPQPAQREKLVRGVGMLRALVDFKPEDISARIEEWKVRLGKDLSDALGIVEARGN